MHAGESMGQRLRISGIFVIIGLLVEALCLMWSKPIAFVLLVCFGGALIGLGVLLFLYSLISTPAHAADTSEAAADKQ
jgi:RsiW-degrading membrane proteinase PrsW (M82 family)